MHGRWVTRVWEHEPALYAPAKYRRACKYEALIPDPLTGLDLTIDARVAGIVSEAEHAIGELNASARPARAPLARLLLRTESIASTCIDLYGGYGFTHEQPVENFCLNSKSGTIYDGMSNMQLQTVTKNLLK
jgi:alkylation response protein AidB-like acyl-CoA dehydrogenase